MSSYYTKPMPQSPGPQGYWPPPPPPPKKWYQRKGFLIPTGVLGGFLVLGVIAQAAGLDKSKTDSSSSPAAAAPTVTVTAPASKPAAQAVAPKTTAADAPATDRWTMPDETGKTLQAAQDDIQDVTDDGIFFTRSTDATGAGRHQILDRGWQVCSQNVAAGKSITSDTNIVFDVVRVSETCP